MKRRYLYDNFAAGLIDLVIYLAPLCAGLFYDYYKNTMQNNLTTGWSSFFLSFSFVCISLIYKYVKIYYDPSYEHNYRIKGELASALTCCGISLLTVIWLKATNNTLSYVVPFVLLIVSIFPMAFETFFVLIFFDLGVEEKIKNKKKKKALGKPIVVTSGNLN